jgi:hypothetical protein
MKLGKFIFEKDFSYEQIFIVISRICKSHHPSLIAHFYFVVNYYNTNENE